MNRKEFSKSLLGITVASVIPIPANAADEKTYLHDDIFHRPYNNDMLVYFKSEHPIYQELEKLS